MWGPIAYVLAIAVFVVAWSRFAAHRKAVVQHILADRDATRIRDEEDALADVHRIWDDGGRS